MNYNVDRDKYLKALRHLGVKSPAQKYPIVTDRNQQAAQLYAMKVRCRDLVLQQSQ